MATVAAELFGVTKRVVSRSCDQIGQPFVLFL